MKPTRDEMVSAYWRYHALRQGPRHDRLAANEEFWAWEAVQQAVAENDADVIELLDALVRAPDADLPYVAAGPLQELLGGHPDRAVAVAERCRRDDAWSETIKHVWLDSAEQARLGPLREMLPPPVASS